MPAAGRRGYDRELVLGVCPNDLHDRRHSSLEQSRAIGKENGHALIRSIIDRDRIAAADTGRPRVHKTAVFRHPGKINSIDLNLPVRHTVSPFLQSKG